MCMHSGLVACALQARAELHIAPPGRGAPRVEAWLGVVEVRSGTGPEPPA